ncbi:branched-chain amino acid ABC transporter permease [Leucobacter soli]|uniref:branched-chain amino acid ABC transporter permease n=1 Tax=Leucobacter soli TaxID=2812850 RepID=UPI001F304F0E|nr:branched-chain amino acid ABC transporter permease [Leucobacter soli]
MILLLGLIAALLGGLFTAQPAHAADPCAPDAATACIQGTIKLSSGEPAADVELSLSGNGEAQTTTTNDEGRWDFTVTATGTYAVTLNPESLPEGQFLKSVGTREVTVEFNGFKSALFPLTDDPEGGGDDAGASGGGDGAGTDGGTAVESDGNSSTSVSSFSWPRFWQQFASGIRMGLLIALASLGLSLIFGTTGLSNFAHGELVSLGGLSAALFMGLTGNIWLAGALAVLALAAFGFVQDKLLWKPLRKRRLSLMQIMIVSIGLSIVIQYLFQLFFGTGVIRIDTSTPATVNVFGVILTVQSLVAMGFSIVAIILVGLGLMYTRFGRATRAISDNPALAQASGINVDRVINIVWIVGGGLAGLAGVFLGLVFNGITWFTGGQMLLLFFAAVTLGGLGTAFGAFVGSMIVGMMVELTNIWLPGDLKFATALMLLILLLLVRPQGIFGRKERIG